MSTSSSGTAGAPLSLDQLKAEVADGRIDTVIVAITDMQGRLQGKRVHAPYFVEHVLPHGTEGCNYLLAVDVDMNTVDGYAMSSWTSGYGDFVMAPDLATLRRVPWHPGDRDGAGRRPLARRARGDGVAAAGAQAPARAARRRRDGRLRRHRARVHPVRRHVRGRLGARLPRTCTPSNQYNVDYSILGTSRVEPLLRHIRLAMADAGLQVESAKGECNFGQHEIAFRYEDALTTCDNHVVYKTAAKEIAAQHG